MTGKEILQAKGLVKQFDGVRAVDRVDFSLAQGEICALIGPNGAGKTTLINLLAGQLHPDAGSITFAGQNVTRWKTHRRARLGLARTFQIAALFPSLTIREHVEAALQADRLRLHQSVSVEQVAEDILQLCELGGKLELRARELSHGDQRLLELAMALARRPKLLLLDEPAAGLSSRETDRLIQRIAGIRDMAILIVEHDMNVVFQLAQRITVIHRGRILAQGPPQEIQRDPRVQEVYLGEP
ncbi:MAG: hypothetical protein A2Z21_01265 [Candidatus Fraserbacteria bacterium RBG_16_55_9]|uniref:ABC transporter domain-containing protein n=1 Tax=Fraserbacteria sp. (strain RBG_16_55_9) TaxID=1817864 RepID=A0A1F5URA7_FRAXR|nr:MAG: hypothetical protein A2Z21_01265 [Candidatus Fraserbacteria bacterium RBG_16_55_9]